MFKLKNVINRSRSACQRYLEGTKAKTKWLFFRRMLRRSVGLWVPAELWFGITHHCQCRCVHCIVGDHLNNLDPELTHAEAQALIDTARRAGVLELVFFGGEPLVRLDTADLIAYASSGGLLTTLYTNGILLNVETVRKLKRAGLHRCNVSLDSALPEVHDKKRAFAGCYQRAVNGLRSLVSYGITCSIWTYASKKEVRDNNLYDLKNIIALGEELGVNSVVILFPIASGNWLCSQDEVLTFEDREKVRTLWDPPFVLMEHPTEDAMCSAGQRFLSVSPQGEVSACPCIPLSYGNVREESFSRLARRVTADMSHYHDNLLGECLMHWPEFRRDLAQKRDEPLEKWEILHS